MAHRAALYTVRVKKSPSTADYQPLGDFDGTGAYVANVLTGYLQGLVVANEDGTKVVECESATLDGEELQLKMRHGENGVAAVINDDNGQQQYRQRATDTQLLSCGGLFVLPPAETVGWLALHVNANRGVKGLLGNELLKLFAQHYDDRRLEITPFVEKGVLEQAIEDGKVNQIRLMRSVPPNDRADAVTDRWLPPQEWGSIEVSIKPRGRAAHVKAALLKRYVGGDAAAKITAFPEIVEFAGMEFDQAKVEVELPNKTTRTFNIEHPDAGHAMTIDLEGSDIGLDDDGEVDYDKLIDALRDALDSVR